MKVHLKPWYVSMDGYEWRDTSEGRLLCLKEHLKSRRYHIHLAGGPAHDEFETVFFGLFIQVGDLEISEDSVLEYAGGFGSLWGRPSHLDEWREATSQLKAIWERIDFETWEVSEFDRQVIANHVNKCHFEMDPRAGTEVTVSHRDRINVLYAQMADAINEEYKFRPCKFCSKQMRLDLGRKDRQFCSEYCRNKSHRKGKTDVAKD